MSLAPKTSALGLNTYKGNWMSLHSKHLLNRTLFGAKASDIEYFKTKGLMASVEELLNVQTSALQHP